LALKMTSDTLRSGFRSFLSWLTI